MTTPRAELTGAERVYRFVAQAIPPILASGYVCNLEAIGLAGVFLLTLSVAALAFYRRPHHP
ncbi:MAG: hypothetical protein IID38_10025, partial [Planctomycetes bacterium]|nr:hypothetical protein [Planctomycetota bacterium]